MHVLKVYLVNGEIHSYPGDQFDVININQGGSLEISESQDSQGNMEGLIAGYPIGSWIYYRMFSMRGPSDES
jgi:hypothetical protein